MKILYLSSVSDWHVDLWTNYFINDHDVFLFSDKEDYLLDEVYQGVTVVQSNGYFGVMLNLIKSSSHKLFQLNKLFSVKYFAKKIQQLVKDNGIEVVHAHNLYFGYLASFLPREIPVIFTPMGSDIILHAQNNFLYRHMANKAFSRANIVTGDSKLVQSQGYKVGARRENNFIIQNGVDTNIFYPRDNGIKEKYGIFDDEVLLFSPRAITPNYNIDTIIESLALMRDEGLGIKCLFSFAFGGEYYDSLKRLVKKLELEDRVIWLGRLSYEEMADHYNGADIIISVPTSDSSPKSVYEAMFCRKPVIVSDIPWTSEILSNSDCIRVTPQSPSCLSKAVVSILDDPKYGVSLAESAYQTALKNFCYFENMSKMEEIMLEVCNQFNMKRQKAREL
ncbi:glycosyltransferase [Gammaproteobacteria bacterium]|nr:glycosyltransferase [Gammaproteobacteria bacterium]